jgi:quercetin dioxygenase-like cupin family protein
MGAIRLRRISVAERNLAQAGVKHGRLWVVGDLMTIKATGEQTNGAYAAFEIAVSPGNGTPPHTHTNEDESFYILEGEVEFLVQGRNFVAPAGALVHAPKGIQHGYRNAAAKPAKMVVWAIPAGLENFFLEVGDPAPDAAAPAPQPNFERILATAPKYGVTIG